MNIYSGCSLYRQLYCLYYGREIHTGVCLIRYRLLTRLYRQMPSIGSHHIKPREVPEWHIIHSRSGYINFTCL